jgi:hypothetical protein
MLENFLQGIDSTTSKTAEWLVPNFNLLTNIIAITGTSDTTNVDSLKEALSDIKVTFTWLQIRDAI